MVYPGHGLNSQLSHKYGYTSSSLSFLIFPNLRRVSLDLTITLNYMEAVSGCNGNVRWELHCSSNFTHSQRYSGKLPVIYGIRYLRNLGEWIWNMASAVCIISWGTGCVLQHQLTLAMFWYVTYHASVMCHCISCLQPAHLLPKYGQVW